MSTQVQTRRGNTAQTAAFTGVVAELTVDTDKKVVVVHDGTTAGGNPLIKANASITTGQILTSNGSHLLALSNTGTAGVYGNASFIPVVTTDAYGRVSSVTNTAIAISSGVVTGVMTFAQGGANATSYTTGGLLTSNGTSFVSVANTGTAGTYANAAYIPVITTDAYGRVSAVTNTLVQIAASQVTSGVLPFAQGGANNTTYTTGAILTSNGTAFVALANTGTAGTYANASYIPVITTDAYGRVSAVTNTAVSIDTAAITSGTLADARLPATGTAGTYANASHVPVITTDVYGRVTVITNTAIAIDTSQITSGTVADARLPTKGTAGTYANAAYIPVITTDAYGRVTGVTNTAVAIDTSALTSGTVADARLPTKGTAGTYANSTHIPVITTDAYGRVTAITNTAIQSSTTSVQGIVQLNDTVTSTSTSVAATANAVNATYNFAATKFNSSGGTISGDTTVTGNLTIIGQTIYANTTTALIADNIITLNAAIGQASAPTVNAGIEVDRGSSANVLLQWNETTDKWQFTNDGSTFYDIADAGRLDSVFSLANGTAGVANTDFTTISASAGVYGNTSYLPVVTLTANGRVSSITNTAIAIDTGAITSGTLADARLPTKGTAGTYANASHVPVITTDAYGRVTGVTNTLIQIATTQITSGVLPFAQGGANATSYTTGAILTSNGTAFVALSNTGTAGTYANAAYVPVITTDDYGRVSAVTNTAISIDTSQLSSGTVADARLPTKGTAGTYANAAFVPVITTDAYGRVTAVTNTAIAIDTSAITSGTLADARLPTKGTAGTYGNTTYIPVITTDAYGRVTAVTNTAISFPAAYSNTNVTAFLISNSFNISANSITANSFYSTGLTTSRIPFVGTGGQLIDNANFYVDNPNALLYAGGGGAYIGGTGGFGVVSATNGLINSSASLLGAKLTVTGGTSLSGNLNVTGAVTVTNTTASTSNTTGAITVAGGIGVKGNVYADAIYDGGVEVIAFANAAFNKANSALALTGGTISGNVTANSVIANNSIYSPVVYSTGGTTKLELTDIGLVGITVAGQTYQFGASGIESNQGIFGGTFAGNRLSLNSETNLISNRYDTVKIQTGTDGTTVNDFIFANNSLTVPGLFTTVSTNITSTTASTSNTTGALKVAGGVGVKGNVSADGIIFPDNTRQTTAATAGASIGDVLALSIALG
jgi:hypothetical protein